MTAAVPFNKIFTEANETKKRYRVLKGGAGSGKSRNVALDYIIKLSDPYYSGANLLVVRKSDASHRNSTFTELVSAINTIFGEYAPYIWKVHYSPLRLVCVVNRSEIIFKGMQGYVQREGIKSVSFENGKLCWIWAEEATELEPQDIEVLDDRLRGRLDNPNLFYQITLTFNPISSTHWLKRRFFDCEAANAFIHSSTYRSNKFLDKEFHARMLRRKKQDPMGYSVYALGEWGGGEGHIITHYDVKSFERSFDNFDSVVLGQDFGFNHANVILTVAFRDGGVYVLDEIYVRRMDTAEIIEFANSKGVAKNIVMYCDSSEPDRIKMWRKAGYRAVGAHKHNSLLTQIGYIKRHDLVIHPDCVNTIREIGNWEWKYDPISGSYFDIPNDGHDDCMAALRYAVSEKARSSPKLKTISKAELGL